MLLARLTDGRRKIRRTTQATPTCTAGTKLQHVAPLSTRLQVTLPVDHTAVTTPIVNATNAGRESAPHQPLDADESAMAAWRAAAGASMTCASGEIMVSVRPTRLPAP